MIQITFLPRIAALPDTGRLPFLQARGNRSGHGVVAARADWILARAGAISVTPWVCPFS